MPNQKKADTAKLDYKYKNRKKNYAWFAALALVVAVSTVWALVQPASTMSGQLVCGMEEHVHTDACYEHQLICSTEESEMHIHTDACWEKVLVCSKSEHTHGLECYDSAAIENEPTAKPEIQPEEDNSEDVMETEPEIPSEEPEQDMDLSEENGADNKPDPLLEQLSKDVPEEYTDIRVAQIPEGGTVYLFAQSGVIPEQVELKAQLVDADSEVFAQAEERVKDTGVNYDYMQALDIALVDETGAEVEPIAPVYVSMDVGALLPEEANPETIQIQHHKENLPPEQGDTVQNKTVTTAEVPKVVVESVLDDTKGTLTLIENTTACVATFPVDSFSIYTITSSGWPNLKIRVQCVDEYGNELLADHKPNDTQWGGAYHPGASFSVIFMSDEHPKIDGYQYDNKAYFMRNGEYESRIYGINRSNNKWYYFPNDKNKNKKTEFTIQPNFEVSEGKDPPDFIRLVYKKVTEIPVQYMDDEGSFSHQEIPLQQGDAPGGKNPDKIEYTGTVLDISNSDLMPKSDTYFFVGRAYVGEPKVDNQVFRVIREDGKPYGVTEDKRKILITEDNPLKLMYHKTQTGTPDIFHTVSTRDKGLTINLFDYNSGENCGPNEGINAGKKLQFVQDMSRQQAYNKWTGNDGGIYTGIVDPELGADGYPRVKGAPGEPGESLDYLFSPELCQEQLGKTVKHLHTDLDHLFWRDRDGYYRYDSMTNFATIMDSTEDGSGGHSPEHTKGGNFVVYTQPALPGSNGTGDNPKFLPFNTYAEANTPTKQPANTDKIKQYHFGMTMEADFIMPPGGVIPDTDGNYTGMRDMIFEFNGDDDVWVFIDGKLVLDLGGIHDRYGGTINFRTGEVTTNAPPMEHSGLRQTNLYGIDDPSKLTEAELAQAREKAGFGKFSQHNFKFFYLERGRGASNCEIRFNLVPVEHGLVVGKRLPEAMDGATTEHMWYQFQAEAEHNGESHPLANAAYSVIKWEPGEDPVNGGHVVDGRKTDEQGRFWLRAGERADFMGAVDLKHAGTAEHDKVTIHISEIFQKDDIQPKVTAWSGKEEAPGTYIEVKDENGQITRKQIPALYDSEGYEFHTEATKANVTDKTLQTEEIARQVNVTSGIHNDFNWIDFENDLGALSGLNITKKACYTDGTPIPDVPFAIKVELWNKKEGNWVPLPVGSDYWILEENEKPAENTKLHLDQAAGGLIYIQDGQWLHLHVLPGTKYRVSEVLSQEDAAVYTTTYEGTTSSAGEEFETLEEAGKQIGIGNKTGIAAGSQHNITITNQGNTILMPEGSFVLTKEVLGEIPTDARFEFKLRILDYVTGDTDKYLQELQCEATYYGTPEGVRPGNPNNGIKETLTFTPAITSGGTDGTPTRGENYESTLFLYPGEMVVIKGLPDGKAMYVQEVFTEDQTGHYTVSFQEEGQNEVPGAVLNGTIGTVSKDALLKVTCRNTSNLQATSTLQISKTVKRTDQPNGEPTDADKQKEFPFRITLQKPAGFAGGEVLAEIQAADGTKTPMPLNFAPSGEDYIADVKLKHGETLMINSLPININVVVQETEHQGYVVSMNGIPGDTASVHLMQNTGAIYEVKCVNMTGVVLPETGGHGLWPYYLVGTILLSTAGWLLYRRKRVHGDK